ncbi:MAG TPA: phosphonate ABC transporter substrate-binding protein, partial [Pantoea sp.]|nr:phosphonate ABC transporter substrate-binding protein [Pantoea sp.]
MKLTSLALLTPVMAFGVSAADAPKQLNLGILGGQNATQQIGDNQCVKTF